MSWIDAGSDEPTLKNFSRFMLCFWALVGLFVGIGHLVEAAPTLAACLAVPFVVAWIVWTVWP